MCPDHNSKADALADRSIGSPFTPTEIVRLKDFAAIPRPKSGIEQSLLISLCAFLLSLFVAIISAYLGYKSDIHDQLAELSGAIRAIQELNLKQIETSEKYSGSRNEPRATTLLANQIYNTTMMASEIAFRVGTKATTATLIPISRGLYQYGQYARAEQLAQIGLRAATTVDDESVALRWLGAIKIREGTRGSTKEGNELFYRAFTAQKKYGRASSPDASSFLKANVKLQWAQELARVDCDAARKHFSEGIDILNSGGNSPSLDQVRRLARLQLVDGIGGVSSCKVDPSSATVK